MTNCNNLGNILGAHKNASTIAIVDVSHPELPVQLSYKGLDTKANNYASYLLNKKFENGSKIAILGQNSAEYLAAYMGIMRAGHVAVPINIQQPKQAIHFFFEDSEVTFSFTDTLGATVLPDGMNSISLGIKELEFTEEKSDFCELSTKRKDTAEILYTSGSTGHPRGVVLSHSSQLTIVEAMGVTGRKNPFNKRRGIIAAPLFHMNALMFTASMFAAEGTVILLPRFNVDLFIRAIEKYSVQLITGVPTMIAMIARKFETQKSPQFSSVETVYIGSAPVTDTIIEQAHDLFPKAEVINSYGTTETGGGLFGKHPDGIERPEKSVGYPLPHLDVRLVNRDDLGYGVLEVKSPSNMTSYLKLPELTAEKIRSGWINTGDIFRTDEYGFYYFMGRADDMFVCNGENIYPGKLESLLEGIDGVIQAAVIPYENHQRGHIPVAFIVCDKLKKITPKQVKKYVIANAVTTMYPRHVFFAEHLPLAATNKVDKKKLKLKAIELIS